LPPSKSLRPAPYTIQVHYSYIHCKVGRAKLSNFVKLLKRFEFCFIKMAFRMLLSDKHGECPDVCEGGNRR
jgi:hypothetical protein